MSRIKPLVWEQEKDWWWTAKTPFGELFIKQGSDAYTNSVTIRETVTRKSDGQTILTR